MEIGYQLTEADLLALSQYKYATSKTLRATSRRAVFAAPLIFVVGGAAIWTLSGDVMIPLVLLVVAALLAAAMPRRLRQVRRGVVQRLYREGKNRALFERQTMRLEPEGLATESVAGWGRTKWAYIESVDATDDHTFVHLNAMTALILPRDGIVRGDYDSFVSELQKRWREAAPAADGRAGVEPSASFPQF